MTRILLVLTVAIAWSISGCQQAPPMTGDILPQQHRMVGLHASDIPFTAANGKETSLFKTRLPITIVAFVAVEEGKPAAILPQLLDMNKKFTDLSVSVVEILMPPKGQKASCRELFIEKNPPVMVLCDAAGMAQVDYDNPAPGTLFLIDELNVIVAVGTLDHPQAVTEKAYDLGWRYSDRYYPLHRPIFGR